ncbi:tetratricopeptide repeat protein [Halosquirtibacter laminarini]|uniref:Tetratricopeptide repeat protein n=1 Tax=Halosquirtibacter laminarini TaxID=3374600 RepID=A0AC61NBU7_9BACT|nr:tetratricopeptide repeat protein [Prolixibacteraceae bacterium]
MIRKYLEKRALKKLNKGWLLYDQKDRKEASRIALKYVNSKKPHIKQNAIRLLGLSYYKMGNYDLSIKTFIQLTDITHYKQDYYSLAQSYLNDEQVDKAMEAFEKITTAKAPATVYAFSHGELLLQFGKRLYQKGYYPESITLLNQLMSFYAGVRSIDSKILFERGLPEFHFFEDWVKKIIPIHHNDPSQWWFQAQKVIPEKAKKRLAIYFKTL